MATDVHDGPPPEPPFDLSEIAPRGTLLEPGVYFDLDEDVYHGAFGLSYTGIKHFRISPYDWWVRSPLNPRLALVKEEEESPAKTLGKAFDARIICGKDYFDARYAPAFMAPEGCLKTKDDMETWLQDRGLPKAGKSKAVLADRILAHDGTVPIWEVLEDQHNAIHEGKEMLPFEWFEKIEMANAMIAGHPELSKALTGGAPQVSVIWDCPVTGVRCKMRTDYLKPKVITDLKTLEPREDQPLELSIGKEIGNRKYYIQAAHYLDGAAQIPAFLKAGLFSGEPDPALLKALIDHPEKEWLWIFQLKGPAPVAKGRLLPKQSTLLRLGAIECDNAKHAFRACLEQYGALPWVTPEPIRALDDADVPAWSLL